MTITSLDVFYIGVLLINGLLASFTVYYYLRRLKLEESKVRIETDKLIIRRNGN
jgi:hypothetical protein